jgi:O-glycosyl hydrolase
MFRSTTARALPLLLFAAMGIGCQQGSNSADGAGPPKQDRTTEPLDTGGSISTLDAPAAGGTGGVSSPGSTGGLATGGGTTATVTSTGGLPSTAGSAANGGTASTRTGGTAGTFGTGGSTGTSVTGGSTGTARTGGATSTGGAATTGGTTGSGGTTLGGTRATNTGANVKLSQVMQVIDGFGVSNAWLYPPSASAKTAVYDALFSVTKGAGLSMLRNRIPFRENSSNDDKFIDKNADGTYKSTTAADGSKTFSLNWFGWDLTNTSALINDIKAKGADYQVTRFMSTPWTPPNNSVSKWKVSDSYKTMDYSKPEVGGTLDSSHYADYADVLADYALGYKGKFGVDLSVLSLQNEPNFQCTYESANWTAAQFHDFLATLKTEFTRKGVFARSPNLKIMAPEYQNVKEDLIVPLLSDANTSTLLGVVGVHQYEFTKSNATSYTTPVLAKSLAAGKGIWMTEFSTAAWAQDTSMTDGLLVARLVHMDLVVGQMSAFLYWWAWGSGNGFLVNPNGTVPKRLYTLGQYSRFVRPDWHRVDAVANPAANVYLSAFKNPAGDQVAVVAINAGTSQIAFGLTIDSGRFGEMTGYRTSASENIANIGTLTGGTTVTVTLVPTSVTTFVGPVTP